jgi:phosphoribosylformimino-5-aminoimidazole carboxamide ribotide isomerase
MQIIPVLDIMHGQVVRGIGGRRDQYGPIVSQLTKSTEPVEVAQAIRARYGFDEHYVADLDAIMGQPPAWSVFNDLHAAGFRLWVDAGVRETQDARRLREAGVATIVAGLETLAGPEVLHQLCRELGSECILFSLDLKAGRSLGRADSWVSADPLTIAHLAIAAGIRRLLVLDLAHVGAGTGTGTEELCDQLTHAYPDLRLAAGGGIGGRDDIQRLAASGVQTVLIASALHDGRLDGSL